MIEVSIGNMIMFEIKDENKAESPPHMLGLKYGHNTFKEFS